MLFTNNSYYSPIPSSITLEINDEQHLVLPQFLSCLWLVILLSSPVLCLPLFNKPVVFLSTFVESFHAFVKSSPSAIYRSKINAGIKCWLKCQARILQ